MARSKSKSASVRKAPKERPADDPEEAGFLEAIRAEPDDDSARLVYADWLEERGDPRSALIRTQLELAGDLDDARRDELEDREREILDAHRARWLKPYPALKGVVWGIDADYWMSRIQEDRHHFSGGLLEAARLQRFKQLTDHLAVFERLGIREFQVPLGSVLPSVRLARFPYLARISALILHNGFGLTPLFQSPHLRPQRLNLHFAGPAASPLPEIVQYPWFAGLRWLASGATRFAPAATTLGQHAELRGLALDYPETADAEAIVRMACPPKLRTFALIRAGVHRRLASELQEELCASPLIAQARSLELSRSQGITKAAFETLVRTLSPRIRYLDLSVNGKVPSSALKLLAESRATANLRALDLGHDEIDDAGAKALASSPYLANLRALKAPGNKIGPAGAQAIAESPYLAKLELLRLRDNPVGKALAALEARFGSRLKM